MKYPILAILIILIIVALGFVYRQKLMSFFSKSNEPQIVEIRDFHCEGMDGFTFRYPVFKGWKVGGLRMSDNGTRCVISLRWPKSEIEPVIAPSIIVIYPLLREQNLDGDLLKNPQGVQYIYQRKEDQADFMPSNKAIINIQLIGISDGLGGGFKTDLFWKQVIESFRIVDSINVGKSLYKNKNYNFEFAYPKEARILELINGDGADPLIVDIQKDAQVFTILVTDDETKSSLPRTMRISSEQKTTPDGISISKTFYKGSEKIKYVGYDFDFNNQEFSFSADLSGQKSEKEIIEFTETIISSLRVSK